LQPAGSPDFSQKRDEMSNSDNALSRIDRDGVSFWDASYRVKAAPALWCDGPVPFVKTAASTFRELGAFKTLELPCGDGKNTLYLAEHVGCLVAADSSPTALAIANRRLDGSGVRNCVLCAADVFATQFTDSQFDAVFCCDLLGHLERADMALKELMRICRPGGIVIGNVFGVGDSTRMAEGMVGLRNEEYVYRNKFYFRFYTEPELEALLLKWPSNVIEIARARWMEGPHEGYREYAHEHESLVFTLRKETN
jgi:ubiquinone/menaquinone biosynthesis C-methylase UbiE